MLLKTLILSLLFCPLSLFAQDIPIPVSYTAQNQHTAFFVSQENSLISYCSLALVDQSCDFTFNDRKGRSFSLRISYHNLAQISGPLLESLKKLKRSWDQRFPLGPIRNTIFITRANDTESLEQLIRELELEPLEYRVLQQRQNHRALPAYMFSYQKAHEIFALFQYYILRNEGRCRTGCDQMIPIDQELLNSLVTETPNF